VIAQNLIEEARRQSIARPPQTYIRDGKLGALGYGPQRDQASSRQGAHSRCANRFKIWRIERERHPGRKATGKNPVTRKAQGISVEQDGSLIFANLPRVKQNRVMDREKRTLVMP